METSRDVTVESSHDMLKKISEFETLENKN